MEEISISGQVVEVSSYSNEGWFSLLSHGKIYWVNWNGADVNVGECVRLMGSLDPTHQVIDFVLSMVKFYC